VQFKISQEEINFALFRTCYVYPNCYLVRDHNECLRTQASGLKCRDCSHHVSSSDEAKKISEALSPIIEEHVKRHHDFVLSNRWNKEVRPKILKYDDYTCIICGKRRLKGMRVHHIIHKSADKDLSPSNLVLLCDECHKILHPVLPYGMWILGWPDMDKVKHNLKDFYDKVRKTSEKNWDRFKVPLEHVMGHLCLICPQLNECKLGQHTWRFIELQMGIFSKGEVVRITDLKDGMSSKTVEGRITEISEEREVDTRYGKARLAYAMLEDDTGKIQLNLWGEDIDRVKEGDIVRVCNGYVIKYEDTVTLNVPKKRGTIIVNPSKVSRFSPFILKK